ncbi:diaminopropionate ammonia-lyase [Arthrobacter sp. AB6]|uniref:diaminopropionate ammonia-lyase n=1 Tax=Arthrobacter sp. AB6 TaxID=2962570 RepID=UPI0028810AA8|nr:diaminopropionate ammonia-lyase [Arthrobacter sp. AB6]MDT0196720.1 diaminopropionate ammonia-lyase [Arthrobacter sp. AB6]
MPTHNSLWYANPAARGWKTRTPDSALPFHRTLADYSPTPLTELPTIADELRVGRVFLKDESNRLGLPAFKILGASWAICRALSERLGLDASTMTVPELRTRLRAGMDPAALPVLVTATDGNHGRAVSRMAALLGLSARIYIPNGLSSAAIGAIRNEGAELIELDAVYDDVVEAAAASVGASARDILIQDTSWDGYIEVPRWIVDGYTTLFAEIDEALEIDNHAAADLVVCPVGVGSLAHAMVDYYRNQATNAPSLLSVEPDSAACIAQSLLTGKPVAVDTSYPTIMSGLNCGTPSELAWPSLLAGLDGAVSVSEDECRRAVLELQALGLDAGPCGASTLAGLRAALSDNERRRELGITSDSLIVLVSTEGLAANPLR